MRAKDILLKRDPPPNVTVFNGVPVFMKILLAEEQDIPDILLWHGQVYKRMADPQNGYEIAQLGMVVLRDDVFRVVAVEGRLM